MKSVVTIKILLLAAVITFSVSAFAGEIESKFSEYLETLKEDDFVSAIIYLEDRPDIKAMDDDLRAEKATRRVRHQRVVNSLREAAQRSQPALLNYLNMRKAQGTVKGFTPYWIMNMVVVLATKGELEVIARRGDVEAIEGNFKAVLIESAGNAYLGSPTAGIGVTKSLKAINADIVWHELGYTGAGVLVANLDTGVQGSHPALTDRWRGNWHPWQECWRDALDMGTTYPVDYDGHGTHVMGTICGAGHETGDTVGVAFDALWIADNSIDQYAGPEINNDIVDAFQWFADPDGNPATTDDVPDVIQNSWGVHAGFGFDYKDCDYRWQQVIVNCEAAGIVVIFSAGNYGPAAQSCASPANICNTTTVNFSVGAVNCENYNWPYPIWNNSSRGPSDCNTSKKKPEVVAPGVSVYSSSRSGNYERKNGTSMAGPHVAGVAALMRQANPNADVQAIKEILIDTARDLGPAGEDNTYGWGIIDALQAVIAAHPGYTISGRVRDGATGIGGIPVQRINDGESCAASSITTSSDGSYSFHVPLYWSGEIRVLPKGVYNKPVPLSRQYGHVLTDRPYQNFSISHITSWSDCPLTGGLPIDLRDCGLTLWEGPLPLRGARTLAIASDGLNGAIMAWYGERNTSGPGGIYVQRVNSEGEIMWNAQGIYLGEAGYAENGQPMIVADGEGGAIVVWYNMDKYIRVQRVDGNGSILWTVPTSINDPVFVQDSQDEPGLSDEYETIDATSDGDRGVFIAWASANTRHLKATRIGYNGSLAEVWNSYPEGRPIDNTHYTRRVKIVPNNANGAMIVYLTTTFSLQEYTVRAHRIGPTGPFYSGWPVKIAPQTEDMFFHNACPDGDAGVIVAWNHWYVIRAQRITGQGGKPWGEAGIPICTDASSPRYPHIVSDGAAGAIIAWEDQRDDADGDIFAQRVLADGSIGWQVNGLPVCTILGEQRDLVMASTTGGSAIAAWMDARSGEYDIYAEKILQDGSMSWGSGGSATAVVDISGEQTKPKLVSDNNGGAILAWRDGRDDRQYIYAMRRGMGNVDVTIDSYLMDDEENLYAMADTFVLSCPAGDINQYFVAQIQFSGSGELEPVNPEDLTLGHPVYGEVDICDVALAIADSAADQSNNYTTTITHNSFGNCGTDDIPVYLREEEIGRALIKTKSPDMSGDCMVDLIDFSIFAQSWPPYPYSYCADFNANGTIDLFDFVLIGSTHWQHKSSDYQPPGMLQISRENEMVVNLRVRSNGFEGGNGGLDVGVGLENAGDVNTLVLRIKANAPGIEYSSWSVNGEFPGNIMLIDLNDGEEQPEIFLGAFMEESFKDGPFELVNLRFTSTEDMQGLSMNDVFELTAGEAMDGEGRKRAIRGIEIVIPEPVVFRDGLQQNYPNPFNPTTMIEYSLASDCNVNIGIYNVNGQLVRTLVDGFKKRGLHKANWDGKNNNGNSVATGVYLYRLKTQNFKETKKLILLR